MPVRLQLRSAFDERWANEQWVVTTCSLCGWTTSGFLTHTRTLARPNTAAPTTRSCRNRRRDDDAGPQPHGPRKAAAMSDDWIVIPGWSKFQHYPNRNPVWIKIYPELLMDDEWRKLPVGTRSLLAQLWLAFASAHGQLRLDTRSLSQKLAQRVTKQQLKRLKDAGWIEFSASKPLAIGYQPASNPLASRAPARSQEQEEETEQEESALQALSPPPPKSPAPRRRSRSVPKGDSAAARKNGEPDSDDLGLEPDPEGQKRLADMLSQVLGGVQASHQPTPQEQQAELAEAERRQAASKAYLAKLKAKPSEAEPT